MNMDSRKISLIFTLQQIIVDRIGLLAQQDIDYLHDWQMWSIAEVGIYNGTLKNPYGMTKTRPRGSSKIALIAEMLANNGNLDEISWLMISLVNANVKNSRAIIETDYGILEVPLEVAFIEKSVGNLE